MKNQRINHQRAKSLEREIVKLSDIKPSGTIIQNYSDFLKHRDFLPYYQYNQSILEALVNLTCELWETKQRISRTSLISIIKRYIDLAPNRDSIPEKTAEQIFKLFQDIIIYQKVSLPQSSEETIKTAINYIMVGIRLKDYEIEWLCENFDKSIFIENRVLRYPQKSKIISDYIKKNYNSEKAHFRRAEYASWLIDNDTSFTVQKKTIEKDFYYILNHDYENPYEDNYHRRRRFFTFIYIDFNTEIDLYGTEKHFSQNTDILYRRVMIWSISYSRLQINKKIELFDQYYSDDIFYSYSHIGWKLKSKEYYHWLISKLI